MRRGSVFSWTLEGLRKPIPMMPFCMFSLLWEECQRRARHRGEHDLQAKFIEGLDRVEWVVGVSLHVSKLELDHIVWLV